MSTIDALRAVQENSGVVEGPVQPKAELKAQDGNGNIAIYLAARCEVVLLKLGLTMLLSETG